MRAPLNKARVEAFMRALGSRSRGSGRVYLTGGATALLHGWREMTADIDIKLDPEPLGAFEAIAKLKNELDMNVELASPDLFIPPVPGWRQRSLFITREWDVEFYHFDPLSQALAKLSRGYERDVSDVHAMLAEGLFRRESLVEALESIESDLIRYPGLDAHRFRQRVMNFVGGGE